MADRIQQRRDTKARWEQFNPVLLEGEVGYVLDDVNRYKIGDGIHTWNDLPYRGFDGTIVHDIGDSENAVMSQKAVSEKLSELGSEVMELNYNSINFLSKELLTSNVSILETIQDVYVRHDIPGLQRIETKNVNIYDVSNINAIKLKGVLPSSEHYAIVGFSNNQDGSDMFTIPSNGIGNVDLSMYIPNGFKYAFVTSNYITLKELQIGHIPTEKEIDILNKKDNLSVPLNFTTPVVDLSDVTFSNVNLGSAYNELKKEITVKGDANNPITISKNYNLTHSTRYIFIANIYDLKFSNENLFLDLSYADISFGKIRKSGLIIYDFTTIYTGHSVILKACDENGVYYADDSSASFKCNFMGVIPFNDTAFKYLKEMSINGDSSEILSPIMGLDSMSNIDKKSISLVSKECETSPLELVTTIENAYVRHDIQNIQIPFKGRTVNVYNVEDVDAINAKGRVSSLEYFGVVGFSSDLERSDFFVVTPTQAQNIDLNIYVPKKAKYAYVTSGDISISKLTLKHIPTEGEINKIESDIQKLSEDVSKTDAGLFNLTSDLSEGRKISLLETIENAYVRHDIQMLQTVSGYNVNVYNVENIYSLIATGTINDTEHFGVVGFSSDLERTRFEVISPNGVKNINSNIKVPSWAKYAYVTQYIIDLKEQATKQFIVEEDAINLDNRIFEIFSSELKYNLLVDPVEIINDVYLRHDTQSLQYFEGRHVDVYSIEGITAINANGNIPLIEHYGIVGFSSDLERTKFVILSPNGESKVNKNMFVPLWAKYVYRTRGVTSLSEVFIKEIPDVLEENKTIIAVGDSITQGQDGIIDPRLTENEISSHNSYSNELAQYLPNNFSVKNYGAGGAKISEIFSRMGWLCGILPYDFTLKGDKSKVTIANQDNYMTDNYKNQKISYFVQGTANAFDAIRTAYIRGIECDFSFTAEGVLSVFRKETVDYDLDIKKGTELIFEGAKVNDGIFIVFAGANGSFTDGEDLADSIKHAVQQIENGKYIVIGSHTFSEDVLKSLRKEFGARFINLKEYLTSLQSFKDIGYEPLTDDEITEERKSHGVKSDIQAIADGTLPPSYWRYSYTPSAMDKDSVHLSKLGYKATAYIINKRLRELGYVK